jgi:Ca2+/Na+ antiporter
MKEYILRIFTKKFLKENQLWVIFIMIFTGVFLTTITTPLILQYSPIDRDYILLMQGSFILFSPILYLTYSLYKEWQDRKRQLHNPEKLKELPKNFSSTKKSVRADSKENVSKGKKFKSDKASDKLKSIFTEQDQHLRSYDLLRSRLAMIILPTIIIGALAMGFSGKVTNGPRFVTVSCMGFGGAMFLINMVRAEHASFWKIFGICLVVFAPLLFFLDTSSLTGITLVAMTFMAICFIYWIKTQAKNTES